MQGPPEPSRDLAHRFKVLRKAVGVGLPAHSANNFSTTLCGVKPLGLGRSRRLAQRGGSLPDMAANVLGEALQGCSEDPLTGFYRDGFCNTGENDAGVHVVCAARWEEARRAGMAPPVVLQATHIAVLEFIDLEELRPYAVAGS